MLLAEVESVRHKHESTLQVKKHDLEVALAVVRSGCEFVEKALQAGGDVELMAMRGTVTCHTKELIQPVSAEAKLEIVSETTLPRTGWKRKAISPRQSTRTHTTHVPGPVPLCALWWCIGESGSPPSPSASNSASPSASPLPSTIVSTPQPSSSLDVGLALGFGSRWSRRRLPLPVCLALELPRGFGFGFPADLGVALGLSFL